MGYLVYYAALHDIFVLPETAIKSSPVEGTQLTTSLPLGHDELLHQVHMSSLSTSRSDAQARNRYQRAQSSSQYLGQACIKLYYFQ
jgi:hypothetical protein